MKAFIFFIFLVAIGHAHAQTQKAPLNVLVMNKAGKAIANDKITFIGQKSGIEIVGITNAKGQFMVHLPAGDAYGIFWMDATTLGGATVQAGDAYGFWTKAGSTPNTGTILPADPGAYTAATNGPAGMWGADNTSDFKPILAPEISTALLGALGALGLLRRRR